MVQNNYQKVNERAFVIVLDGVGAGELPDAAEFGDAGSNTLGNLARAVGGLDVLNLAKMGLGNILPLEGVPAVQRPTASFGKMSEVSIGKDTTTGHWEHMGVILDKPFPVYPDGFPEEVINAFSERTGRGVLGNKPASGTAIIDELGEEHIRTGALIVYTSADSVFQIAAHKDVVPLTELYKACEIAREILRGEHEVVRVIARPFVGGPGAFERTHERRDYSVTPPEPTTLDLIRSAGMKVYGVGKISEIFAGHGIDEAYHNESNLHGIEHTLRLLHEAGPGLIYVNLVDFDTKFGHRNDCPNFAKALKEFDEELPRICSALRDHDSLFITADHGNDPTTPSTDHAREHVPLLAYGKNLASGVNLGTRSSFADLGKTICDLLGVSSDLPGKSFYPLIQAGTS